MKKHTLLAETELMERGVEILVRTLGPVETVRFLAARPEHRIESVRRHRKWQTGLDQKGFFKEVFGPDAFP